MFSVIKRRPRAHFGFLSSGFGNKSQVRVSFGYSLETWMLSFMGELVAGGEFCGGGIRTEAPGGEMESDSL